MPTASVALASPGGETTRVRYPAVRVQNDDDRNKGREYREGEEEGDGKAQPLAPPSLSGLSVLSALAVRTKRDE